MRQPKIITTMASYSWPLFVGDAIAGLTVAMVALPLSLAIAIASGAPPETGLVTAIVGGFFISLLGGSRVQIGGPTGAFIVVVYGVIAEHGYDGLVTATLMAGLILLVAGYFRVGRLISYIPEAVVSGFTIGIAIVIAFSQFNDFFGLNIANLPADMIEKVPMMWEARAHFSMAALVISVVTIAAIALLRRLAPKFPGLIVVLAVISLAAALLSLPVDTLFSRYGALPNALPMPALPAINLERIVQLLPSAIVIAFLAGVESLLSAMVADKMVGGSHRPNAELLAQGAANIASSLFAGLPATGAIARTATNVRAGGKTPVAGLVHALTILVVMFLAAGLVGYLVMPALAALLVLTAWNMSEPHKWPQLARAPLSDKVLLLVTLMLTVLVDLTVAIGVGVSLGLALRLYNSRVEKKDWTPPER